MLVYCYSVNQPPLPGMDSHCKVRLGLREFTLNVRRDLPLSLLIATPILTPIGVKFCNLT